MRNFSPWTKSNIQYMQHLRSKASFCACSNTMHARTVMCNMKYFVYCLSRLLHYCENLCDDYHTWKYFGGGNWLIWWTMSYSFSSPVFTDTPKMHFACALTSLFTKFFLTNSFYLYGLPKFPPTKNFPCMVSLIKPLLNTWNVICTQYIKTIVMVINCGGYLRYNI